MNLDDLQRSWENQACPDDLLGIDDPDTLVAQFQAKSKGFTSIIYWRDIRESAVAFAVAVFFLWAGAEGSLLGAGIAAACMSFVGIFIVVDRALQRRRRPEASDSVLNNIRAALAEVEHQIWLLRNVLWRYLAPIYIGVVVFIYIGLTLPLPWSQKPQFDSLFTLLFVGGVFVFVSGVYAGVIFLLYVVNQRAVRNDLEPRRAELAELLHSLESQDDPV